MRVSTWLLTAAFCVVLSSGHAVADEPAGGKESPEATRAKALASGMDALKLRVEAAMKRAALLEKAGRTDEALAIYEQVEGMYAEGLKELRALIAASRGGAPRGVRVDKPFAGGPAPGIGIGGTAGPRRPARSLAGKSRDELRKAVSTSIDRGLAWLASTQKSDGGWQTGKVLYRPGVTGLAVLSFLGAGYTHEGNHRYNKVVGKALDYLRGLQDPEGCFGRRSAPNFIYNHAMATLAVVEAYGLTEARLLHGTVQRALDFSGLARNPYFGWRYGVKPGDNDTSVTHWMLQGIYAAKVINDKARAGQKEPPFTIDEGAFLGAIAWVDKMTEPKHGRVGYIVRGTGPARPRDQVDRFPGEKSEAMTAAGINIRVMAGQEPSTNDHIRKGANLMWQVQPIWHPTGGTIDMYYWYLGTQAMRHAGGKHWRDWRDNLIDAVVPNQQWGAANRGVQGSWDPVGPWGPDGGRVYSTSLMLLSLQVVKQSWEGDR